MAQEYPSSEYPLAELTEAIIAAAIEVHKNLGPGYLEKIYENALVIELEHRGHRVDRQQIIDVYYRDVPVGRHVLDLLVDQQVVIELKSVESLTSVHIAQVRSTLKAAQKRVGLLINFNQATLTSGLKRVIV